MGFKFEGRMMATNIKKCKFSNPNSGPAIQARASQTVSLCRATIPLRGGGGIPSSSCGHFKHANKWHLPALIVNDVVATESHLC